jgi:hypothetical protein
LRSIIGVETSSSGSEKNVTVLVVGIFHSFQHALLRPLQMLFHTVFPAQAAKLRRTRCAMPERRGYASKSRIQSLTIDYRFPRPPCAPPIPIPFIMFIIAPMSVTH